MTSHPDKARAFSDLHQIGTFIMPNAWDAGSAKIIAAHGFKALWTTSSGFAIGLGRPDALSAVSLDETVGDVAEIAAAVEIPVSADFENGYADEAAGERVVITARCEALLYGHRDGFAMASRWYCSGAGDARQRPRSPSPRQHRVAARF